MPGFEAASVAAAGTGRVNRFICVWRKELLLVQRQADVSGAERLPVEETQFHACIFSRSKATLDQ